MPAVKAIGILLLTLLLGGLAGWYLRGSLVSPTLRVTGGGLTPESAPVPLDPHQLAVTGQFRELALQYKGNLPRLIGVLDGLPPVSQMAVIRAFTDAFGESFETLMYRAEVLGRENACGDQVNVLLGAALKVQTQDQQQVLDRHLSVATDACARRLIALKRFDAVDQMYEQITLALPEQAQYFLKLGQFRIRMGNFDGALTPLAQIENHGELGAEARALMKQAEVSEDVSAPADQSLPLRAQGAQYVVKASIDDGEPVELLVDTGAAMTIVDASLLRRLGYGLEGEHEYFATANGVVDAPVVSLHRLSVGNAGINELAVGALDLDMPEGVHGLLGMNFLRHFHFRIDQDHRTLHLDPRRTTPTD